MARKCVCGFIINDEPSNCDPVRRKPCPQCGSLARDTSLQAKSTVHLTVSGNLTVIPYPQVLLALCKGLVEDTQFAVAVVVAHMACEVATERSLSAAFAEKKLKYLEGSVLAFLNGYNLQNEKLRKFYCALTGDHIEQQPFWSEFKASAERRNKIIHRGASATKAEAESSYRAASAFVAHLKQ